MKILDINLTNFQGIASLDISLGGKSASIFGDNGTGKTTVFNAITWLLFDKPSTGAKNWTPKTRGADGEKHNLEHSVTATFVLQNGSRVTLGKTLREVYKKKRGTTTAEYTGNTVDYYLDGVPVKEKEYTAAVAEYCGGEQTMKLLTMPDYFPEAMEWKKRRELLLEICGDITDDDVIEGSPELHDLPSYLIKPGTVLPSAITRQLLMRSFRGSLRNSREGRGTTTGASITIMRSLLKEVSGAGQRPTGSFIGLKKNPGAAGLTTVTILPSARLTLGRSRSRRTTLRW